MVKYLDTNSGFNQWNAMQKQKSKSFGFWWWLLVFLLSWWLIGLFVQPTKNQTETQQIVGVESSEAQKSKIDSDKISLDVQGLRISDIELKDFLKNSKSDEPVALLSDKDNFIEVGLISSDVQTPNINTQWTPEKDKLVWKNNSRIVFSREISVNNYVIKISDNVKNNSGREINVVPYARIVSNPGQTKSAVVETGGVVYANSDINYANWMKLGKKSYAYSTVSGSLGFADQYWETIASVNANDQTISLKKNGELYFADTMAAPVKIAAGTDTTIDTYIFAGPREARILNSSSEHIPGLNKTMDYGWFWFFAQPMLWTLNRLYNFVGNYGIAIILMTLILRLLMWPLTRKSYASTMALQKMQPEIQKIQKLYANDKARQQIEMMRVYKEYKTSPMSGCLPMLIQIPIFFALYKALLISVPMRTAQFLWISDLAKMDPYFILPMLMGATMWLQQYLQTPKSSKSSNDVMASTQRAMKWLPVLFAVMFAWMPAGLVLYWTVSNIFGIIQMYLFKKTIK